MDLSITLKTAFVNATKFAISLGAKQMESEHLLYGILTVDTSPAVKILNEMKVFAEKYKMVIIHNLGERSVVIKNEIATGKSVAEIFAKTDKFCMQNAIKNAEIEHVLYFMMENSNLKAVKILRGIFNIDPEVVKQKIKNLIGNVAFTESVNLIKKPSYKFAEIPESLQGLGYDLTKKVANSDMAKIIGRDQETERLIETLCRKTKNNPVLVGEAGVGKSSVVEGLAQRIILGEVPGTITNKTIFALDLASLMAGTKFRGSMEQKLKDAINAIQSSGNIIIFIDEIHMLAEAGSKDGEISPSDILKPYLARGELQVIGATTVDEYKKYIEKDPALERRFQPIRVEEPSPDDTIKILKGIRPSFEKYHGVKISDEAIDAAVSLSSRYITNRYLPDKAIDLFDEACSKARVGYFAVPDEVKVINLQIVELEKQKQVYHQAEEFLKANEINKQIAALKLKIEQIKLNLIQTTGVSFTEIGESNIREVVSNWTNIPVQKLTSSERETLLNLEKIIGSRVIGQDGAVAEVSKAIRRSRAEIGDPKRPIGSFLFLGPTGVGKTELTKAIADVLFDSEDNIIRFDMSEFMESHSISRLIGAPPGYVGHEDGGELTEKVRQHPYSIVLFDEIEKAHSDIFNILLQIFDEGRLTDSRGKVVNFKNTVIILTSNNGVQDLLARRKFEKEHPEQVKVETQEFLMDKLRDKFKPELLNRIDSIVIFDSLSKSSVMKIANIMINSLEDRFKKKDISLKVTESARNLICEKGYDELYGARPLRRVIDKEIKDPLAEKIISGELSETGAVEVDVNGNNFIFNVLC
ncbi:MAG: ATP-dependent Clp protease ATP-binding subunit [Clostridia bacterium]|nr:ATP-dependent Clp protease ATP-binding subunit [Clostridia bacterium]